MSYGTTHSAAMRPAGSLHKDPWYAVAWTNWRWIIVAVGLFLLATLAFVPYALSAEDGPHGGGWIGLAFGVVATIAVMIPMLIPVRNQFKSLRFGKPANWMQAHIWFGLLSYPLALFHAGSFAWHGLLAVALMWIFTAAIFSGIICLFLQRSLPTVTTLHTLTGDRRHAARQRRTQALLNAWLIVHVPLAYAMLALIAIHAVMSLRYAALR